MHFLKRAAQVWLLGVLAFSIYVSFYNRERVGMQIPPWIEHITVPAWQAYTACFVSGAVVMSIYFGLESLRKSLEIRRLTKRLAEFSGTAAEATSSSGPKLQFNAPRTSSQREPIP